MGEKCLQVRTCISVGSAVVRVNSCSSTFPLSSCSFCLSSLHSIQAYAAVSVQSDLMHLSAHICSGCNHR